MACVSVEMSPEVTVNPISEAAISPSISPEMPPHPLIPLHPCTECSGPMLLMSATYALHHPIKLRKTYQCMICESVEVLVAPAFD